MKTPKVIVISGSSRFIDIMAVVMWILERNEGSIAMGLHLLPQWYPNLTEHHLAEMGDLHLRKIDLADEVFVVNFQDYIGESTKREIEYAKKMGKPIRWFTHDIIGDIVIKMMFDSIKGEK